MPYPIPTPVYHITHVNNLPSILAAGGLYCQANAAAVQRVNIAHLNIQMQRAQRPVPLAPHGSLHNYVPFYFGPRSPMLYTISRGNVQGYKGPQTEIVHLVSTVQSVNAAGLDYVFTDGHAIMALSRFFNLPVNLARIDWPLMRARDWFDDAQHPDRKRRRQAEFLVHQFVPWSAIIEVGVMTEPMQRVVQGLLGTASHPPVTVHRPWYY